MIAGLSHMTLIVHDLDAAADFFTAVFGAEVVYSSGDKKHSISEERFLLIGDLWVCIMKGDLLPEKTYNHVAFRVSNGEFDSYVEKIKAIGVEIRSDRPRIQGEARSVYFYDYDNHLLEIHTGTLEQRLEAYAGDSAQQME